MSKYKSNIEKITDAFCNSNYEMAAPGMRFVGWDEIYEVIKILRSNNPNLIAYKLHKLHKYRPESIEMDKSNSEMCCPSFDEEFCNCFLPDIKKEDHYCTIKRRNYLKTTDYRNTPEYREWRKSVFERDKYTCMDCDKSGGNLNAHHLKKFKDYPELRYKLSNGMTLCVKCHRKRHKK